MANVDIYAIVSAIENYENRTVKLFKKISFNSYHLSQKNIVTFPWIFEYGNSVILDLSNGSQIDNGLLNSVIIENRTVTPIFVNDNCPVNGYL
jgi:hypothetical protein